MHRLAVSQVMLAMGRKQSRQLATGFDGITRYNPEGLWFRRHAQEQGRTAAVKGRDSGEPTPEGDEARALVREMEDQRQTDKKIP